MLNGKSYNCSEEVMTTAIEGIIFSSFRLAREDKDSPTDYQYLEEHLRQLTGTAREYEKGAEDYAVSYYDATWALAFALNSSFQYSEQTPVSLVNYMYGQPKQTDLIRSQLNNLELEVLLGKVSFQNRTQDSSTLVDLHQCMDNECASIGFFDGRELTVTADVQFISDSILDKVVSIHTAIIVVSLILAVLSTLFTIGLHLSFIVYRKEKSIKATSYELSHILFSGCYVLNVQAFLGTLEYSGWQETNDADSHRRNVIIGITCNVITWLHFLGIILILSTLTAQLWRLYQISNHISTRNI